jgi:hypothetical protein
LDGLPFRVTGGLLLRGDFGGGNAGCILLFKLFVGQRGAPCVLFGGGLVITSAALMAAPRRGIHSDSNEHGNDLC